MNIKLKKNYPKHEIYRKAKVTLKLVKNEFSGKKCRKLLQFYISTIYYLSINKLGRVNTINE